MGFRLECHWSTRWTTGGHGALLCSAPSVFRWVLDWLNWFNGSAQCQSGRWGTRDASGESSVLQNLNSILGCQCQPPETAWRWWYVRVNTANVWSSLFEHTEIYTHLFLSQNILLPANGLNNTQSGLVMPELEDGLWECVWVWMIVVCLFSHKV